MGVFSDVDLHFGRTVNRTFIFQLFECVGASVGLCDVGKQVSIARGLLCRLELVCILKYVYVMCFTLARQPYFVLQAQLRTFDTRHLQDRLRLQIEFKEESDGPVLGPQGRGPQNRL